MQQLGKLLLLFGLVLAALGLALWLLGRAGVARLPGDVALGGRNWRIYLPIGTSIFLSLLLTLLLYILSRLRR
jgi:hypothetical protein